SSPGRAARPVSSLLPPSIDRLDRPRHQERAAEREKRPTWGHINPHAHDPGAGHPDPRPPVPGRGKIKKCGPEDRAMRYYEIFPAILQDLVPGVLPIDSVACFSPNWRIPSKRAIATALARFKLRASGRIGTRSERSGHSSSHDPGRPRLSGPKTKASPGWKTASV